MTSKLLGCIGFLYKVVHKTGFSLCSFSQFSFPFNFQTANALVLKFGSLSLRCLFPNTLLAIFDIFFRSKVIHRFVPKNGPKMTCGRVFQHNFISKANLRGAWSDRDTNDIFAHCSLIFYFLDFKFSNFICLFELHPLIWFFFKKSFRKKKSIRKTTQNALAPSIFIILSIALKLGTPLLHTQAQNTLLQNFQFRSRS